jgi:uncharacterized protein YjiS (DUF1127 family)
VSVSIIRAKPSGVTSAGGSGSLSVWWRLRKRAAGVVETLFAWHARSSDRQRLLAIDGHMLRDIGVTKIAVQQEAMKPFWRN